MDAFIGRNDLGDGPYELKKIKCSHPKVINDNGTATVKCNGWGFTTDCLTCYLNSRRTRAVTVIPSPYYPEYYYNGER